MTTTMASDSLTDDAPEACSLCEELDGHHPECIPCPGDCGGERVWAEHGACSSWCGRVADAEARADSYGLL